MRLSIRTSLFLAAIVLSAAVPAAHAVNLTGTWTGTVSCDLVVPENLHHRTVVRDQVIDIKMVNNFAFVLEFQDGATPFSPMAGAAVDDGRAQDRGKVAAQLCTGNLAINYFFSGNALVNDATGTGSLTGQFTRLLINSPGFVETCRATFRRTSAATPTIDSTCP
jgi:hypothetical protein